MWRTRFPALWLWFWKTNRKFAHIQRMKVRTAAPMFLLQDVNIHKLSVTVGCLYRSPSKCCIRMGHYHILDYKHYSELGYQNFLLRFLRLGMTQTSVFSTIPPTSICPGLQIRKTLKKQMAPTTDPPRSHPIPHQTSGMAARGPAGSMAWRSEGKSWMKTLKA